MPETTDLVPTRPMTADDVLAVFIDNHRQQVEFDCEANPDAVIHYDMTIYDWREACDLVDWRPLGRALNTSFSTSFSDDQWKEVLEPAKDRTLRGVCELLATAAVAPQIQPISILGKECSTAGAFVAVRNLLARAGADVSDLKPSSPLAPYARNYLQVFILDVAKMAPGKLPSVKVRNPLEDISIVVIGLSLLTIAISDFAASFQITAIGVCLFALGLVGAWITARIRPKSVEFGNLQTFSDLCRTMTGQAIAESDGQ